MTQELHEHQGLVDVAHTHALGDVVPQALVGGGGGLGHGGEHCLVTVLPEWRCEVDLPMPSPDPELQRLRQNASALPLGARIIRAVASSTAIETGQPVAEIERALINRQPPQATPA
jgi:hypothetical protein